MTCKTARFGDYNYRGYKGELTARGPQKIHQVEVVPLTEITLGRNYFCN